jgi:hypothetical protein
MGLSSHQRTVGKNQEWLTPPEILKALGPFDLDPCAPVTRPWDTAARHYTIADDGLSKPWEGRVWLNPPFDRYRLHLWLGKMAWHRNGIALIAARTETENWQTYVWPRAHAILFMHGRPHFHYVDGRRAKANSGAPLCLVAYGKENGTALEKADAIKADTHMALDSKVSNSVIQL